MSDLKAFHEQVKKGDLAAVRAALAADPALLDAAERSRPELLSCWPSIIARQPWPIIC